MGLESPVSLLIEVVSKQFMGLESPVSIRMEVVIKQLSLESRVFIIVELPKKQFVCSRI
jgi:hypothetical protein